MRIIKSNPNIIENIEIQTINGADYRIGLFFESKDDKNAFMVIPWGIINSFTYADDIRNVGLTGEIILDNISNVLIQFLIILINFIWDFILIIPIQIMKKMFILAFSLHQ